MKGVKTKREGNFYYVVAQSYEDLLQYLQIKKPVQCSIAYDPDEGIVCSIPVAARTVHTTNSNSNEPNGVA
jgi:hypothetical protein